MPTYDSVTEAELDGFDAERRRAAVVELAADAAAFPRIGRVNLHLHTFHSFNYLNYSPERAAWEAAKAGLLAAGVVDFDVLDALPEFFFAADAFNLRAVCSLETRVFVRDFADREINSPGEPGVAYFMAAGFGRLPERGSAAERTLLSLRRGAEERNRAMLRRLLPHLGGLEVDYDRDVLPLTPSGNATERHLLAALDAAARRKFPEPQRLAEYWAGILGVTAAEAAKLLGDAAELRNAARKKLMKQGGPGYERPNERTFPPVESVAEFARACGALPCVAWLDGCSAGEENAEALLDYFLGLGCRAISIIPERNWNIKNAEEKRRKVAKLAELIRAAEARALPLLVGTEMNNYGQPFCDDLETPELRPYAEAFRAGALTLYGHTLLERAGGRGMAGAWAEAEFGCDRAAANAFYRQVGTAGYPPPPALRKLERVPYGSGKAEVLRELDGLGGE